MVAPFGDSLFGSEGATSTLKVALTAGLLAFGSGDKPSTQNRRGSLANIANIATNIATVAPIIAQGYHAYKKSQLAANVPRRARARVKPSKTFPSGTKPTRTKRGNKAKHGGLFGAALCSTATVAGAALTLGGSGQGGSSDDAQEGGRGGEDGAQNDAVEGEGAGGAG